MNPFKNPGTAFTAYKRTELENGMRTTVAAVLIAIAAATPLAESAAGVRWTAPAGWKTEGPRPMRAATYTIAPAEGDSAGAEGVINYFGPGQGGGVEANVERWKGQMLGPDGKPAPAKVGKRVVNGISITTIDATGGYSGMGGPMAATPRVVPGYRLLGAIVEGPGGHVFVKFTGPQKTVGVNQKQFEQLLSSFQLEK